jgi:TPR repeat protein
MKATLFALFAFCLSLVLQAETEFERTKRLAELGFYKAQFNLGVNYDNGIGVPQDYKEAFKWYRKAAEQECDRAQFNLGVMYHNGEGVHQDYKEAVKWFAKSAEQGNAEAQYELGVAYYNGRGVPQDYKEAFKWYTKSAEQGEGKSQFCLGSHYYRGDGVIKDYVLAYAWYSVAKANNLPKSKEALDIMGDIMSKQQIAVAQALAKKIFERIENKNSDSPINQSDSHTRTPWNLIPRSPLTTGSNKPINLRVAEANPPIPSKEVGMPVTNSKEIILREYQAGKITAAEASNRLNGVK